MLSSVCTFCNLTHSHNQVAIFYTYAVVDPTTGSRTLLSTEGTLENRLETMLPAGDASNAYATDIEVTVAAKSGEFTTVNLQATVSVPTSASNQTGLHAYAL